MPNGEDLLPCARKSTSSTESAIDHVITKTFKQFDIPFQITDNITSIFTAKLWRMEKCISKKGGTRKKQQQFDMQAKQWVNDFKSIYQCTDVTPYMHSLAMHVSQFLTLHGNISKFGQQGLEKLNDFMTIFYQHISNHREQEALKQVLEKKQNR